ncbi:MAG: HlyD family efflux transporter periplasmic adaptor subunit [Ferruginibacter sp.]
MPKNNYHIADITGGYKNGGNNQFPALPALYEVNSEEVQDIMSKMPHWIIRQGTAVLFVVIILLFAGSYFIHYPDVTVAGLNISSSNPPVKIVAQSSGRIHRIFVRNNQLIKKDEKICLLENAANYADIILLKNILDRLDTALILTQTIKTISFNQYLQLGELQPAYADLYQSVNQYLFFVEKNFITQKVGQLQSQVIYQSELNKELQTRDILLKQQLMLENKKFQADSFLVKEKIIAPLEFDNSRKELINKQMNADATKSGILQNKLQQTEYLKTITELKQQKLQQQYDLQQKIKEDVKRLHGQLEVWEQKYLMKSPVDGKTVFFNVWKENQYITNGEPVLMIVPPIENYVAMASLPVDGAGKVKTGQEVLIRLSSYPFEEFGMIRGRVANISAVALDTAFSMEILLPNGLTTTTNKKIPSRAQLSGIAEVLTDDKNILQRLFEKIWTGNKR